MGIKDQKTLSPIDSAGLNTQISLPNVAAVIDEKFEIQEEMARGGMGIVFRAKQLSLDRDVALKILPRTSVANSIKRFQQEASMTAKLQHPNTVRIYDYGFAQNGDLYLAMEILRGHTMHEYVRKHGAMSSEDCLLIAQQAGEALKEVHQIGIVHRDIKPSNILVTSGGTAKLVDAC